MYKSKLVNSNIGKLQQSPVITYDKGGGGGADKAVQAVQAEHR